MLFVGINPGVRSATVGHHFAESSNRFWKLLYESGLVTERIGYRDDDRLGEWDYGIAARNDSRRQGVFVLPNPSGRNANFSYAEMRSAFRSLARYLRRMSSPAEPALTMARTGRPAIHRGRRAGSPSR